MADNQLRCVVAIPTRELFSGQIAYASVPSIEGYYGVLPGHEMIVAANMDGGVLTLNLDDAGTQQRKFLLFEGASQVYNNILTVLGRFGCEVDKIDVEAVREKAEGMRKHIAELEADVDPADQQEHAELETSRVRLKWYELQLNYAQNNGR